MSAQDSTPDLGPSPEPEVVSDTGPFTMAPAWVVKSGLSDRAVRAYLALGLYADYDTGANATPSRRRLATDLGWGVSKVDEALKELRAAGAILSTPRRRDDGSQTSNRVLVRRANPDPPAPGNGGSPPSPETREPRPRTKKDQEAPTGGRQRNLLFDAVVEVCGIAPERTRTSASMIGKAVRELKEVGATPDEIRRRAAVYRGKYRGADLTPTALLKHWPSLGGPARAGSAVEPSRAELDADEQRRKAWLAARNMEDPSA